MNQKIIDAKAKQVEEVSELIKGAGASIVVEYRGLSVSSLTTLRKELKKQDATLTVIKNSIISRAASKAGYADLDAELTGPNALVITSDPAGACKTLVKFAKRNEELVVKGGIVEGKVVSASDVKVVASLPNKEGLLSMFLGCLQASVRNFACAIKAVADAKAE